MKKYVIILFLLAGLSTSLFAQGRGRNTEGAETITYKQKKSKKQMAHFEKKKKKDRRLASNGTNYRKSKRKNVDGNGFRSVQAIRKDDRFGSVAGTQRVRHQKRLIRTVYAPK